MTIWPPKADLRLLAVTFPDRTAHNRPAALTVRDGMAKDDGEQRVPLLGERRRRIADLVKAKVAASVDEVAARAHNGRSCEPEAARRSCRRRYAIAEERRLSR